MDLSPVRGLVLCMESDGSAALETRTSGSSCGECGAGAPETTDVAIEAAVPGGGDCSCVDIPVPSTDGQPKRAAAAAPVDAKPALAAVALEAPRAPSFEPSRDARRVGAPATALRLALIRSVVLLV